MLKFDKFRKDIEEFSNDELIKFRASLDAELSNRGISFSVGLLGEKLSIEYFNSTPGLPNLQQAPTGVKNVDAL